MDPGAIAQSTSPPQRVRSGSQGHLGAPLYSLSPDDGYDYHDKGPSPEDEPTRERVRAKDSPNNGTTNIAGVNALQEDADHILDDWKQNIYERHAGSRRAKIPDEENQMNVAVHADDEVGPPARPTSHEWTSRWRRRKKSSGSISTKSSEKAKLRHVMLHWEKEEIEGAQRLVLNARVPTVNRKSESQNYVVWQHCELEDMTFEKLESLVTQAKSQGLQESEIGLTRRLLKRVRKRAERAFVGGSFLEPLALRYDILDGSKYSVDKCCIFLAFPYFAVDRAQPSKPFTKGGLEHPVRTLLQSCYRLNDTAERDRFQCVKMLDKETLRSCINASEPDLAQVSRKVKEELIYVPQLWTLILGLDKMITTGPISDSALQGKSIKVKDQATPVGTRPCSLVRINFINQGRLEDLTYPAKQCASWFGLLNKHQQIRGILKKEKEKVDPKTYRMEIGGQMLENRTWASVQRSARDEVLNIWMKTPKGKVPKVSFQKPDSDSESESQRAHDTNDESDEDQGSSATASAAFGKLDVVPVISAFFEWRILDEFGEADESPLNDKLNRFLKAIYHSLPAAIEGQANDPPNANTRATRGTRPGIVARPELLVDGKTLSEVGRSGSKAPIAQNLYTACKRLFGYFLPETHDEQSAPIQLFWGAIYEIMDHPSYVQDFLNRIDALNAWAEQIHLGVHYERLVLTPDGEERREDAISESAILLSSIVDALGAIFNMLVEAVRDIRHDANQSRCRKKACGHYKEACRLLETARDELITEASGAATGENVGPVLTPEAILIMLMERLVCGVFRRGNVNVIRILEECVEQLALEVRDRYSRRLLQMINAFEEEIGIVNDVLLQQKRVLVEFREYLNPASFNIPSTARKMRFDFEKKGIERILVANREQLKNCAELKERTKTLAVQNVHLVETMQDDNGRAIFIFTFITVLFLPLTFIAGVFGMNLVGISDTTSTSLHFWEIALPVTGGIIVLCAAVIVWGERIWFGVAGLPRRCREMFRKKRKGKVA